MSLGFGMAVCPDCYEGEQKFIFINKNYFLNRIILPFFKQEGYAGVSFPPQHLTDIQQELEIVE